MNHQPLGSVSRERLNGASIVRLEGEIDLHAADQLNEALSQSMREAHPVVVDLAGCQFIDSTGIGAIVRAFRTGQSLHGDTSSVLILAAPVPDVKRVLEQTLDGLIPVFASRDDALSASRS